MPTPGLSLVGFIDHQAAALHHLRWGCVPNDGSDAALIAEWNAARAAIGHPTPNAGNPQIQPIPASHDAYVNELLQEKWVQSAFQIHNYRPEFRLVEIAPLLAYQFHVDADRSDQHCNALHNPTLDQMLPICLPKQQLKLQDQKPIISPLAQSIVIKSRNLNVRQLTAGAFAYNQNGYESVVAGMQIHVALPFVHVVRLNGRCYLHNGYHRAYGLAKAGATHMPCFLRDAANEQDAGIVLEPQPPQPPVWQTFPSRILQAANAPTVGHFVDGRARQVNIRSVSRVLTVTWVESALPDEHAQIS